MGIQPKNHFTQTMFKVKTSLNDARIEIHKLNERYENIALGRNLTEYERTYLAHINQMDELLMEFIPIITFL
jgi:hypothetical protein